MSDAAAVKAFTREMADSIMMRSRWPATTDVVLVSPYVKAVFVVHDTALTEAWNWRRTKRELRRIGLKRKGVRREYHKAAA